MLTTFANHSLRFTFCCCNKQATCIWQSLSTPITAVFQSLFAFSIQLYCWFYWLHKFTIDCFWETISNKWTH